MKNNGEIKSDGVIKSLKFIIDITIVINSSREKTRITKTGRRYNITRLTC